MCLTTMHPEIKIADRDIKVYKNLVYYGQGWLTRLFRGTRRGTAWIMSHEYERGVPQPIVKLEPRAVSNGKWVIEEGYHSDKERIHGTNALFIIPKGAAYIEGWNNDDVSRKNYVSETIIFKKRLKKK